MSSGRVEIACRGGEAAVCHNSRENAHGVKRIHNLLFAGFIGNAEVPLKSVIST